MLGVEEDFGFGKSVYFYSGVILDKIGKEVSLVCLLIISSVSYNFEVFIFFLVVENVFENWDEWIKVDGKWIVVVGFFFKINVF